MLPNILATFERKTFMKTLKITQSGYTDPIQCSTLFNFLIGQPRPHFRSL